MTDYRLLNYAGPSGEARPGLSVGDSVIDLEAAVAALSESGQTMEFSARSTLDILEKWDAALPSLETIATAMEDGHSEARPLSEVRLMAPLLYPSAIFNAAANYYAHRAEMGGDEEPVDKTKVKPYMFLKSPAHTVIGPGDEIRLPRISQKVDWEAELGVVIGRYGRNLSQANARDIVAGYTIFNDVSARDLGRREEWPRFSMDWFAHKTFETSAPMGPWIVPASSIPDPYKLKLNLWVNDDHMQEAEAGMMIFNIEEQIEFLSARITLRPGDVIATGTPAGVGAGRGIFLKAGDKVRITIDGIGELENPVAEGE